MIFFNFDFCFLQEKKLIFFVLSLSLSLSLSFPLSPPRYPLFLLLKGLLVGGPPCLAVLLRGGTRVRGFHDPPPDDDDVAPFLDHDPLRRVVLLSQRVAARRQLHPGGHVDEARRGRDGPGAGALRDEAADKVQVGLGRGGDLGCVGPVGQRAGRRHLREQQQAPLLAFSDGLEPVDDSGAREQVRVRQVRPVGDLKGPGTVLRDDGVSDVGKLAVLEDHKVVLLRQSRQLGRILRAPAVLGVDVGLEHRDVRARSVGEGQDRIRRRHVGRDGEVCSFAAHQLEQGPPGGALGQGGALLEGEALLPVGCGSSSGGRSRRGGGGRARRLGLVARGRRVERLVGGDELLDGFRGGGVDEALGGQDLEEVAQLREVRAICLEVERE